MSTIYSYYAGYLLNGKIYPWGPYDKNGGLYTIIKRSRSYGSRLYQRFRNIPEECISAELEKEFGYEEWVGKRIFNVKYLSLSELPDGDFIKKGFFLVSEVKAYESEQTYFSGFTDCLSPEIYLAKFQNELNFGKNAPKVNSFGETYTESNASDYMYFSYPDYESEEYEAHMIRHAISMLREETLPEGAECVVLEYAT